MDYFLDPFVLQSISDAGSVQQCGRHFRKRGAGKMRMEASGWRAFRERVAAWNQPPGWRLCPPARAAAAAGAEQTEQSKRAAQRGGGDGGTSIASILIQSSVCEHAVNAGRSPAAVRSRPRPTDRPTDRPVRPCPPAPHNVTLQTRAAPDTTRAPPFSCDVGRPRTLPECERNAARPVRPPRQQVRSRPFTAADARDDE